VRRKAIEQNHLVLAFPAPGFLDPRRYPLLMLNTILGGGVSSRLFQQLRERKGMCYTVYSYVADHAETSLLGIYTALNREMEGAALRTVLEQVYDLAEHGPTREELERTREQAKANVLMGLESVQSRMSHLGTSAVLYGTVKEADEILAEYDRVTREDLRVLAGELFRLTNASLSAVGRVDQVEEYETLLSRQAQTGRGGASAPVKAARMRSPQTI
jgi:predicted Zn-dependent peptidase